MERKDFRLMCKAMAEAVGKIEQGRRELEALTDGLNEMLYLEVREHLGGRVGGMFDHLHAVAAALDEVAWHEVDEKNRVLWAYGTGRLDLRAHGKVLDDGGLYEGRGEEPA